MASSTIIPIISRIHWDDLLNQFSLKITWQLNSPFGIYFKEEKITAGDLAGILAEVVQIWATARTTGTDAAVAAPPGDFTAFGSALAVLEYLPFEAATMPTPVADETPFDTAFVYDGVEDAWGQTISP